MAAAAVTCSCGSSDPSGSSVERERPPVANGGGAGGFVHDQTGELIDGGQLGDVDAASQPEVPVVDAATSDAVARVDAAAPRDSEPFLPPACSAQTCQGCCRAGVCEQGVTEQACGLAGSVCAVCASNFMCTNSGECLPDIDPKTQWRVQPLQTGVAEAPPSGAWDPGDDDTPDVMVVIDCRKGGSGIADAPDDKPKFEFDARTGESSSLMPMWSTLAWGDCTLTARELLDTPLRFRVFDNDSGFWGLLSEKDAITPVLSHQVTSSDLAYGRFALPPVGLLTVPLEVRLISK